MTDKSICMRCAELMRLKVKKYPESEVIETRICSVEAIEAILLSSVDTVQECSRYVEVPGDKRKRKPLKISELVSKMGYPE